MGYYVFDYYRDMIGFSRSLSSNRRQSSFGSPRVGRTTINIWISRWFRVLVATGSLISFLLAFSAGYIYVLPSLTHAIQNYDISYSEGTRNIDQCNVYNGSWVVDDSYPLYNASECPFVEQGFNCLANGRMDDDYLKWRWKPKDCKIPRFNVQIILNRLQNKRVVFVGDSMSRTQWESLICLLMTGVEDKTSVYEVNGNKITKQIRFLGVKFSSFNFTIEFYRSVFLVHHDWAPRHVPKRVRSTLKLDKMDEISNEWINSDILIFNSGQWWVPGKLFGTGCYFQVNNSLKLGISIATAFRIAAKTWASWVNTMINENRTHVYFRTFEPSHWSNQTLRLCNVTHQPLSEIKESSDSIFSDTIFDIAKSMTVPVTVLHITPMSAYRSDAHVGFCSDKPTVPDCSHWCLPGVPDAWNEIFLSHLLAGLT